MKFASLFILTAALFLQQGWSCDCGPKPTVPDALAEANVVFAGRCVSGKLVTKHIKDIGDRERCQFTFEVTRIWKGAVDKKQITVETGIGWGDCGYGFAIGTSYILYCYQTGDTLDTNICTRTCITGIEPLDQAEMEELDKTVKAKIK